MFTHLIGKPEKVRFEEYCIPVTESGCILFLGQQSHNGYGRFVSNGRRVAAHRYAWVQAHGPIPSGQMVCHKCDTPACVNLNHLFLGTCKENKRDSMRKGRHSRGRVASYAKGHSVLSEDLAREIFDATGTHQAIADAYGIRRQLVTKVKAKLAWAWIHDNNPIKTKLPRED